jgi:hypothetical protein
MTFKQLNISHFMLIPSIVIIIYIFYVVVPFGDRYDFFNEGIGPQEDKVLSYFFMTVPILTGYLIFLIKNMKKVTFLRCINYPLIIFNLYFLSFICFSVVTGGAIFWLMIFTFFIPLILIPFSFVAGLIKDLKSRNKEA